MPNHVHIIGVPGNQDSLARTFNTVHMLYAQYFNRKRNATVHLWQGRFFSCALDERHLYAAVRYVEMNPVRIPLISPLDSGGSRHPVPMQSAMGFRMIPPSLVGA